MKTNTDTETSYRIKAAFGYYPSTIYAPADGYLTGPEEYDYLTGRTFCEPLEFSSVADADAYLTEQGTDSPHGYLDADGPAVAYDGRGQYSANGIYCTAHGQHSRPVYTIVSRASGRCTKAIIAACDAIHA